MRKILISFFVLGWCLPSPVVSGEVITSTSIVKESRALYVKGLDSFLDGDIPKAKNLWSQAVELDPNNLEAKRGLKTLAEREKRKEIAKPFVHMSEVEVILSNVKWSGFVFYGEGKITNKSSNPIIIYGRRPGEFDSSSGDFYIKLTSSNPKIGAEACKIIDGHVMAYEGMMTDSQVILKPKNTLDFFASFIPYQGEAEIGEVISFRLGVNTDLGVILSHSIAIKVPAKGK